MPTQGGRKFKKGQTGNPKGSSAKAKQIGKIRAMTALQVAEIGTMMLEDNMDGLRRLAKDENSNVLSVWMGTLIVKSMAKGDPAAFRAILDRIVGKPKESLELTGKNGGPVRTQDMTREDKLARLEALRAAREAVRADAE